MSAREAPFVSAREREMQKIRAILAPSWAEYWNKKLSRQSRRFFMEAAEVRRPVMTTWAEFSADQQAAIRRAFGQFAKVATLA